MQTIQSGFASSEAMICIYFPYGPVSVPAAVYSRLDEWARWVRPRVGFDSHGRCASAEGRFVSRYPGEQQSEINAFDLCAVLDVEKAVCNKLPKSHRKIVYQHFVLRNAPQKIARALGIHRANYGKELKRAILMVKNNLTRV